MPTKRKSAAAGPKSHQSTLAFHGASNKVTKAGTRAQTGKNLDSTSISADVPATKKSETKPEVEDVVVVADDTKTTEEEAPPTTSEAAIVQQVEQVIAQPATPHEEAAKRITDAQIKKYWTAKEKQRRTPRVHQSDISLHEKILREFDMSSQYGPCTGIARLKRWNRAQQLGLAPPTEVLAVLMKEQEGKDKLTVQRSHVDELLNSRNVPPTAVEG